MNTNLPETPQSAEILLYQTEDGQTRLEVRLQDETVWLSQKRMAELFQKDVRTINEHIKNIFAEGELRPESVIRNFRITADDGKTIKNCRNLGRRKRRNHGPGQNTPTPPQKTGRHRGLPLHGVLI